MISVQRPAFILGGLHKPCLPSSLPENATSRSAGLPCFAWRSPRCALRRLGAPMTTGTGSTALMGWMNGLFSSSPSCARSSSYRLGLACGHFRPHISSCVAGNTTRKTKGSHRRIKCRMEMENETREERERRRRRERASWWRTETRRKPKHKPHTTTNTANSSTQPPKSRLEIKQLASTLASLPHQRAERRIIATLQR